MKRVLFVNRDATRSGAPFVLLHLLQWLRAHTPLESDLLLLRGGPLSEDFAREASLIPRRWWSVYYETTVARASLSRVHSRLGVLKKFAPILKGVQATARRALRVDPREYDLIYLNSVASGAAVPLVQKYDCPILTHIHELEYLIELLDAHTEFIFKASDHFITVSHAVKENLVERHGVAPEKISVVHGFIDTRNNLPDVPSARAQLRRELGVPDEALLVGASGGLEWHKGPDLFLQTARGVRESLGEAAEQSGRGGPPVYFVWIGSNRDTAFSREIEHDLRHMGLGDSVCFVGQTTKPRDYYAALDVFLSTSREDTFPLVCLESASMGVPVVCFEGAGGMPEFVEDDCGFVVPYSDAGAMARAVTKLIESAELRRSMGETARLKVRERHDISVGAAHIYAVMERVVAEHRRT